MSFPLTEDNERASDFSRYREYTETLHGLACRAEDTQQWNTNVVQALDGQAASELRRLVHLEVRRRYGAYFTGSALANKLLSLLNKDSLSHIFYDPACGAGDLLLAAARRLPLESTIESTLAAWGQRLAGTDVHREFVEAAITRLVLLARQRLGSFEALPAGWRNAFPLIQQGNGLQQQVLLQRATHVIMNPPFGFVDCPKRCGWASGRVSEAAIFIVNALEGLRDGATLLAILPEVLRSGTFYHHWRRRVCELAKVQIAAPYGTFDGTVDVDVFMLSAIVHSPTLQRHDWPSQNTAHPSTVADYFDVHVGRVVPHRDPERGPHYPFLHARGVPVWAEMRTFPESRRFEGVVYQPPLVVIRRTSRPSHPYRAAATLVLSEKPMVSSSFFSPTAEPVMTRGPSCLVDPLNCKIIYEF